ncbi:hypothetical protein TNIN_347831 [Trichonephila inaurata madagascariensis]|uniref:Uncharacterized protein n=1 Tax=Trichonephila inaurata madagascariensis TaxID=2747483 RepID=A0A8X6X3R2_9ARAC|nr:hypothetical protein TNIN_347831 [Trichonephila inaurata madagascariensis]
MLEIENLPLQDDKPKSIRTCYMEDIPEEDPIRPFMYLIHYVVNLVFEECDCSSGTDPEMTFHPYDTIRETLENLHYVFMRSTDEIFLTNTEKILGSRTTRVSFLLSRCLAICDQPSNISFLVVLAFIYDVIYYWRSQKKCYSIFFDCEFCLCALYKRKFWKVFRTQKDYDELVSFSRKLLEILEPKVKADEFDTALDSLPDRGMYAYRLMENCVHAAVTDLDFTPSEIKFLGLNSEDTDCDKECERCKQWAFKAMIVDENEFSPVALCMKLSKETFESLEEYRIYDCSDCNTACSLYFYL